MWRWWGRFFCGVFAFSGGVLWEWRGALQINCAVEVVFVFVQPLVNLAARGEVVAPPFAILLCNKYVGGWLLFCGVSSV